MSFSRLVTFGCSLTFGMNLDDNYPKNAFPSKFSWPVKLAKLLDIPITNKGILGASNKEILYTLLNYNFNVDDIVFVLWSHYDRHCIIEENTVESLGAWQQNKRSRLFFKQLWNFYDRKIESYFYYNFAHLYLQEKNIKHVFLVPQKDYLDFDLEWNLVNFLNIFFQDLRYLYPFAKDKHHPGIEAHKIFAEEIYYKYKINDFYTGEEV
jgi:hypothetical protein